MKAQFKKMKNGEWRVAVDERVDVDGGNDTVTVSMRDGSKKQVKLTRLFSREGDLYLYVPVSDKRPAPARKSSNLRQYKSGYEYERGVCEACVYVEDFGDARGCAKHRGNPHT